MQIPRVESDPIHNRLLALEPKLLALIEKYANRPMLLEKLLLSDKSGIRLETRLEQQNLIMKLPIKGSESLTNLNLEKPQLLINQINGKVLVSLATQNNQLSPIPPDTLYALIKGELPIAKAVPGAIQILFNQIRTDKQGVLNFISQPVPGVSKTDSVQTSAIQTSKVENAQLNQNSLQHVDSKNQLTASQGELKQLVSQFLQNRPLTKQPLSQPIKNILQTNNKLLNSSAPSTNPSEGRIPLSLNQSTTLELANTLVKYLARSSVGYQIGKLILANENLRTMLQPQHTGKDLNQKVLNSGALLERNLLQNIQRQGQVNRPGQHSGSIEQLPASKPISTNKIADSRQSGSVAEPTISNREQSPMAKDLKSIALQLKQQLDQIKQIINHKSPQPLDLNQALRQLANTRDFQKLLLPPELQLAGSSVDPKSHYQHNSQLASQQANHLFNAQILQKFPWINMLYGKSNRTSAQANPQLIESQRALVSEMLREVNTLLSRIETNQLTSLKNDSPNLQQLLVELPLQNGASIDSFEVLFESKNTPEKPKEKIWNITIRFDLEPMGPMFAKVTMQGERISTHFYAEQPDTAKLLAENMEHLKDNLLASGVEIDEIKGSQGNVPNELVKDDDHKVNFKV